MYPHEMIKLKRLELGMSEADTAQAASLSIFEYGDVEQHRTEFISAIPLYKAKLLCQVLGLDMRKVLELEPSLDLHERPLPFELVGLPRHKMVEKRRLVLRKSVATVADAIGYDDAAVVSAEFDGSFLENYPVDVLAALARELDLPLLPLI